MSTAREELVFKAKLAEQIERYEEMVEAMKKVVQEGTALSVEERNLLSVAYKNVIGTRRSSWRIISSIEAKDGQETDRLALIAKYRKQFEKELKVISDEILVLVDEHLLPKADTDESKVFYLKMKGDYFRYMAEFSTADEKSAAAAKSLDAYEKASAMAKTALDPTHPIRLGLALNFSVFHYEIQNDPDAACKLAKNSFDEAISQLDALSEETYKDSTLIMQLLRDNLTLWTSEKLDDGKEGDN